MNNMNFEEFKNWAEENIKFFLPESYRDAKIDIHDVVKTGMSYTGMTVRNEDQSIAPAINLNASYEAYEAGKPLYAVGHDMAEIVQTKQPELNTGIFSSYDSVKKNLFIRVCNTQENSEMLKNVPHTDVEDLSVTYHVMVDARESGLASATVTNAMIDSFGISKEQLHEDAVRNSQEILPARMDSMMNMLMGLSGMDDAEYEFGMMAPPPCWSSQTRSGSTVHPHSSILIQWTRSRNSWAGITLCFLPASMRSSLYLQVIRTTGILNQW